jgi:hypothetical protein
LLAEAAKPPDGTARGFPGPNLGLIPDGMACIIPAMTNKAINAEKP